MKAELSMIIAVLFFSFQSNAEDTVLLKQTKVQGMVIPAGNSLIGFQTKEEKDLMPGNNDFGFFFRDDGNGKGVCRIRTRVVCDYGMEFTKPIVNREIKFSVGNLQYQYRTDTEGLVDLLFRCEKTVENKSSAAFVAKHMQNFTLQDAPKEIRVADGDCK